MTEPRRAVHDFLAAAPLARAVHRLDLGFERSATIWVNQDCRMTYDNLSGHTFSMYLLNGDETRRVDGKPRSGWPGALSILPQGQNSIWEIASRFQFVHLHMPDAELRSTFADTLDRDARLMSVPELTFASSPQLAGALLEVAQATAGGDALQADAAVTEVVHAAFANATPPQRLLGGLAPAVKARVRDFILADLGRTIRLRELAEVARLSEFHFQRAFIASFGVSPHSWLLRRRIAEAKVLLRDADPVDASIADIAANCGFSSQSHLTRAFKLATGATPAAYRTAARS